jgi:hypothetical protein
MSIIKPLDSDAILGWIEQEISPILPKPIADHATLDRARELVVANEGSESVDVLAAAVAAIARLSPEQRANLARAEPFSSALRLVEQESEQASPPHRGSFG